MTWQEGNLMSIQTSGNNKDQGSATFTYTEYPNPWVGIDVGAIALTDLEEAGYVTADVEGQRNGRTVRYSADRGKFVDDLSLLWSWMVR